MNAQTSDPDQALPYLVVNTGGHPIARFADEENASEYAAGWLGLLPPINTAAGASVEDAVARWRAEQQANAQHSDAMSDRIRRFSRIYLIVETAFAANLILILITILCIKFIDGGNFEGPWALVLDGLLVPFGLIGLSLACVVAAASKQGIEYLPSLGDYLRRFRDRNKGH
ncbi:hypothetical protein [Paenarthrobacter sp. C1]|uniref:hypothetical protein n=1 Tax=Paenarthrobacter sp. C1 TaxID=3400220 RepID=UPI003BF594AF